MKREYARPNIVEYGKIDELTLGSNGTRPDIFIFNGQRVVVNTVCDPASPVPGLTCGT